MRECWLCHRHEAGRSLPLGAVMWVNLPKPPSGRLSGSAFFHQTLMEFSSTYRSLATIQVGNPQSGDDGTWQQESLMLLETLRTRDPDELAEGFRRWELRFRQLGGGPFRGELKFLQLGRTQILRASGNRKL